RLLGLTAFAALFPFVSGASVIQEARIERAFRHRILTFSQTTASVIASVVAILVALRGGRDWAVVAYTNIEAVGVTIVTLIQARWLPGLKFERREAIRQIRFATPLAISAAISN